MIDGFEDEWRKLSSELGDLEALLKEKGCKLLNEETIGYLKGVVVALRLFLARNQNEKIEMSKAAFHAGWRQRFNFPTEDPDWACKKFLSSFKNTERDFDDLSKVKQGEVK